MVLPEGNTRTIITFCCQFIEAKGWFIDSDLFRENAQYMRTALVAANAVFYDLGDMRKTEYIEAIILDSLKRGYSMKLRVIEEIKKADISITERMVKEIIYWNRKEGREHNFKEMIGYIK